MSIEEGRLDALHVTMPGIGNPGNLGRNTDHNGYTLAYWPPWGQVAYSVFFRVVLMVCS